MISKGSINRPNVFLQYEELCNDDDFTIFGKKVSKTIKEECCKIYTDFINNIGPYYGEMDAKSRYSDYMKWKTMKLIVATVAFGMGINKEDIRLLLGMVFLKVLGHQTEPVTLKLFKIFHCRRMMQLPKEMPQTVTI